MPNIQVLKVIVVLTVIGLFIFIRIRNYRSLSQRRNELLAGYPKQPIFICNGASKLRGNLIQIYGEAHLSELKPGMQITSTDGTSGKIAEVYADDDTPDTPDDSVSAGVLGTPIVIEIQSGDWGNLRKRLATERLILFKLRQPFI